MAGGRALTLCIPSLYDGLVSQRSPRDMPHARRAALLAKIKAGWGEVGWGGVWWSSISDRLASLAATTGGAQEIMENCLMGGVRIKEKRFAKLLRILVTLLRKII